jgi:hypothetical protein
MSSNMPIIDPLKEKIQGGRPSYMYHSFLGRLPFIWILKRIQNLDYRIESMPEEVVLYKKHEL